MVKSLYLICVHRSWQINGNGLAAGLILFIICTSVGIYYYYVVSGRLQVTRINQWFRLKVLYKSHLKLFVLIGLQINTFQIN